jgi:hypothetical protein
MSALTPVNPCVNFSLTNSGWPLFPNNANRMSASLVISGCYVFLLSEVLQLVLSG